MNRLRIPRTFPLLRHLQTGLRDPRKTAVVLLSGGLDSATALAIAHSQGFETHTLAFDYCQRHRHELQAAAQISEVLGSKDHRVAKINAQIFSGSALTDDAIVIPKHRSSDEMGTHIPVTYVPARNTIFLSYALALAESMGASDIFIGANAVDYSGYPDCRPEFFRQFQQLADVGTRAGVERGDAPQVRTPLLHWTKKEIIECGLQLGVDYGMTHSCYDPGVNGRPCGGCDSCILRAEAFLQLGFRMDPAMERFVKNEKEAGDVGVKDDA